jgi:hypothetical protein
VDNKKNPEDIFNQVEGKSDVKYHSEEVGKNTITATSSKIDEKVKTIEGKAQYWQDILNDWRKNITQNEQIIIITCFLIGAIYSYAVNKCTGNVDVPIYAYVMSGVIVIMMSFLLIADKSLPLLVLIKFAVSVAAGHLALMHLVAVDGHGWGWITSDVCRFPITTDKVLVWMFGIGCGVILTTFKIGGGVE